MSAAVAAAVAAAALTTAGAAAFFFLGGRESGADNEPLAQRPAEIDRGSGGQGRRNEGAVACGLRHVSPGPGRHILRCVHCTSGFNSY